MDAIPTFLLVVLVLRGLAVAIDDDSGSIEMPHRPENRQETTLDRKVDGTVLSFVSKMMNNLKGSFNGGARRSDRKYLLQKIKKALNRVDKAYAHVEKARNRLLENVYLFD